MKRSPLTRRYDFFRALQVSAKREALLCGPQHPSDPLGTSEPSAADFDSCCRCRGTSRVPCGPIRGRDRGEVWYRAGYNVAHNVAFCATARVCAMILLLLLLRHGVEGEGLAQAAQRKRR